MTGDVGIYLPSLHPGGAEKAMINLGNWLSNKGYSVELVVGRLEGEFIEMIEDDIDIIDLDIPQVPLVPPALGMLPSLRRYFVQDRVNNFISSMNHINIVSLAANRIVNNSSRMIVVEHNDPIALSKNSKVDRLIYSIGSVEYPWADKIIGVSEGVAKNLAEAVSISEESINVIHNPIITNDLFEKAAEKPENEWLNSEYPVIINVGRLTQQKNHQLLLKSFQKLREQREAKLIIVGRGDEEQNLLALSKRLGISSDFQIINWVDNPYSFMSHADVFALSSKWEGLGMVLVEALGCMTPVVSTDCPSGPGEVLEGGKYGELVQVANPAEFSKAMIRSIDNPPNGSTLRNRAMDFGLEHCGAQYEELLFEKTEIKY